VRVAGLELLVAEQSDPLGWGCYPMAPWVGRIRNSRFAFDGVGHRLIANVGPHAIHGTVFDQAWVVDMTDQSRCELSCDLGGGERWPFRGRAVHTMAVDPGGLHLRLRVETTDERMPASLGWHPWFARDLAVGGELQVGFDPTERWQRDADGLPAGGRVPPGPRPAEGWDDCFSGLVAPPVLTWPGALEVTLTSDCEEWVLYDAPTHAVCVEPQTSPPDALNMHPRIVEPGRPLEATFDWRWRLG